MTPRADEPTPMGSRIESATDRREVGFLRWAILTALGLLGVLGGIVWNRVAGQVDINTQRLAEHSMALQRLELDAGADRKATAVQLANIAAYLQAIGARLNVPQPPPQVTP